VRRIIARGVGVSIGIASGPVKVVKSIDELDKVEEGDILVARASNPAWTIAMTKAAGFIIEIGGIICHAAIVAREMGVPCIVNVENAMSILRDGMKVSIDGREGIIYED
jgi:pyruvate,water dikinase